MDNADVLIDAINTLLGFLPEEWKPRVQAALALLSAGSAILALWRPFIAYVAPKVAGSAPYVAIDRLLDYLVINSRRVEVRPRVLKARMSSTPPPKRKSGPPFGFCLALALGVLLVGCAGTAEQRTRTTLDTLSAVVDPAYSAAMDGCVLREQAVLDAVKQGFKPAYEGLAELKPISERCEKMRAAFDVIRSRHDEAAKLVESGRIAEAEEALRGLTRAWAALKGGDS